jgi:hypothetical protein
MINRMQHSKVKTLLLVVMENEEKTSSILETFQTFLKNTAEGV